MKTFLESMFICQISENCFDNTSGTINQGDGDNVLNKSTRIAKIHYYVIIYYVMDVIPARI